MNIWQKTNYWTTTLAVVCLLCCPSSATANAIEHDRLAKDFTLKSMDDVNIRLTELRGSVVLIYFMANDCDSCSDTLRKLDQLYQKYKGKNFVVLGIRSPQSDVVAAKQVDNINAALNENSNVVILETESASAIANNRVTEEIIGQSIANAKKGGKRLPSHYANNVSFPVLIDDQNTVQKHFQQNNKPLLVLIDRFGYQRYFYHAQASDQQEHYQEKIEKLLAQKIY